VLASVVAAAVAAGCADTPAAPAPRPTAPAGAIAANAFGLTPAFTPIGTDGYQEGFTHTGDISIPVAPIAYDAAPQSGGWAIVRHQRDPGSWYQIEQMDAWHGSMCQRPDDRTAANRTHPVHEYRDMVFLCRNHIMTATNARGYGVNYLTPSRMVDFSTGSAVVRFDVATLRESGRDWIDLWLTPYGENLVTPLDDTLPDLQGEPRNAFHLRMTSERARSAFIASVIRNHVGENLPTATDEGYEAAFARTPDPADPTGARVLAPSATRRDTFELHISRTHVKFGMPRYNLWWVDADIPGGLDWSRAVLQLGHHSFDPTRESGGKPTTWHWDNVGMAPAVPFTILRADRRFVDEATRAGEINFPAGAPEGAHLRFSAIGQTVVRFGDDSDDEVAWLPAVRQAQERQDLRRFSSYWMPIPPGTTRVRFRPVRPLLFMSDGHWMVRDIAVWSPNATVVIPPTPPTDDDDKDKDKDKDKVKNKLKGTR
jgi:hypothetical protein